MARKARDSFVGEGAGANVGGLLQLWVEMLYFKRVLGSQSSKADEQCQETLRLIAQRVLDALKAANPQDLLDLQRFTVGVQVRAPQLCHASISSTRPLHSGCPVAGPAPGCHVSTSFHLTL